MTEQCRSVLPSVTHVSSVLVSAHTRSPSSETAATTQTTISRSVASTEQHRVNDGAIPTLYGVLLQFVSLPAILPVVPVPTFRGAPQQPGPTRRPSSGLPRRSSDNKAPVVGPRAANFRHPAFASHFLAPTRALSRRDFESSPISQKQKKLPLPIPDSATSPATSPLPLHLIFSRTIKKKKKKKDSESGFCHVICHVTTSVASHFISDKKKNKKKIRFSIVPHKSLGTHHIT